MILRHEAEAHLEHVTFVKRATAASKSSSSVGRVLVDDKITFDDFLARIAKLTDSLSEAVLEMEMLAQATSRTHGQPRPCYYQQLFFRLMALDLD